MQDEPMAGKAVLPIEKPHLTVQILRPGGGFAMRDTLHSNAERVTECLQQSRALSSQPIVWTANRRLRDPNRMLLCMETVDADTGMLSRFSMTDDEVSMLLHTLSCPTTLFEEVLPGTSGMSLAPDWPAPPVIYRALCHLWQLCTAARCLAQQQRKDAVTLPTWHASVRTALLHLYESLAHVRFKMANAKALHLPRQPGPCSSHGRTNIA